MKYIRSFFFLALFLLFQVCLNASNLPILHSDDASIKVELLSDNQYYLAFSFDGKTIQTLDPLNPVYLEIKGKEATANYYSCELLTSSELLCKSLLVSSRGSEFSIEDKYIAKGEGRFELQRKLNIITAKSLDSYFNSLFGFIADPQSIRLSQHEYFVPGVWYKGNFTASGNLPQGLPNSSDTYHYYREDRITLPLVMFRNPTDGFTMSIIHKDSPNETVVQDANNIYVNKDYQFGSLGIKRENDTIYTSFIYPGSEHERPSGSGYRFHPVEKGVQHEYNLEISFSKTSSYADGVRNTWNRAFELSNPKIYPVDLSYTYDGLIETLLTYYVPNSQMGGIRDAAGFPFQVSLTTFEPMGIDYQMGFVGMQIATGYYLYREGIEKDDQSIKNKGAAVLDFWANNCLTSLGFPRTWYDPGLNGNTGSFRGGSDIRVCTGGMEGLIAAWAFAKKNKIEVPAWINACKRFGDWLVDNQNADGSYFFSYNQNSIVGGKHPASNYNKYLTICAVRYLVELYIATGDEAYKIAALKAGDFCYRNIHEKYMYVACVVDNPQTIDSESGQMALNGFLALYDLTQEIKWLNAAEQAATYTETWVYSQEISVEKDRTGATSFPKDRSIVGQHLIAIGHSAADLGFAWSSFAFYRLYLETGNPHYLKVARISAHNTKQSMNWDGSLFPGQPKGLQLEAFQVMIPRRCNGVMTTLNWNYAAHLDPMFRFKDAFGTPNLEEVEQIPWDERIRLNKLYAKVQSANYGQEIELATPQLNEMNAGLKIYPNPFTKNESQLTIELPNKLHPVYKLDIYNVLGEIVFSKQLNNEDQKIYLNNLDELIPGIYYLQLDNKQFKKTNKLIIK